MKRTRAQVIADDKRYTMQTYGRQNIVFDKAEGRTVYDMDGRAYLDLASGIGVTSLGHGDTGWLEAVMEQVKKFTHCSNYYYSEAVSGLARKLCEQTSFERVFFANSGCEANECAIKIARKYAHDTYGPGRHEIITLKNSFHGRSITTLSATGQTQFHHSFFPFTEGFKYAPANDTAALTEIVSDATCAIMIECIQGEGGVIPMEKDYVRSVAKLCEERGLLLIVDEVQTGIGRTGKLLAFEHYDIRPDIVTLAKGLGGGLPIGACLCNKKLADVLQPGDHGTTFGGNPVSCAAAQYVLDTVGSDDFLAAVRAKGARFKAGLAALPKVCDLRQMGLMIGFRVDGMASAEVVQRAREEGVLAITASQLVRLLPPLTITDEEIDRAIQCLAACME
ncbi:MAG: aspartate aminotransferase family protein [Eubacteriales bacterium]|nr:aspartate aminotransferase family protein [Eubacteriales bacterium]